MGIQALFGDVERELCAYLRGRLRAIGVALNAPWTDLDVTNAQTDFETSEPWQVVVRDDGGTTESMVTRSHAIATTIIGPDDGTDPEGVETHRLAELVMLAIAELPEHETSVAAVTSQLGPYRVLQGNGVRPARYATHELVASGRDPVEVLGG